VYRSTGRQDDSGQLFKKSVMLLAENAKLEAVYWPTAVIPVTNTVPFNSDCSWVMKLA
jgi:hypothetical protein